TIPSRATCWNIQKIFSPGSSQFEDTVNSMSTEQKLPISVCIIAGNEARRIRRALESVTDWTTEIVAVLNEEVNDGTEKIFAEYGAKIFREPWKVHIAQKNSA